MNNHDKVLFMVGVMILKDVIVVFPSLLVVSSSIGYFRCTVTNRTLSPSVAAKILPFKRTVAVAAPYPAASRIPFGYIFLLRFPRPPCGTRQQSSLPVV
ncbi:MAG: hypothetical protein WCF23_15945 [Candidatus Nitrosopolaris sp.]